MAIYPKGNMCHGNGCKVLKMTGILLVPWRRQGLPERKKVARSSLKAEERGERRRESVCVCIGGNRAAVGSYATYFCEYRGLRHITISTIF